MPETRAAKKKMTGVQSLTVPEDRSVNSPVAGCSKDVADFREPAAKSPGQKSRRSGSYKSKSSYMSSRLSVKQVAFHKQKEILKLEEEIEDLQLAQAVQLSLREVEVEDALRQEGECELELNALPPEDPEVPKCRAKYNEAKRHLSQQQRTLQHLRMSHSAILKKKINELELLRMQSDIEIQKVAEDEDERLHLSDDSDIEVEDPIDPEKAVEMWAEGTKAIHLDVEERRIAQELKNLQEEEEKELLDLKRTQAMKRKRLEKELKVSEGMWTPEELVKKVKPSQSTTLVHRKEDKEDSSNMLAKILARQSSSKDLPEFHGRPEQWPMFISEYRRTTAECGYTDSENLIRLRKCLKGEALAAVQLFMVSPDCVPDILSTLEKCFGDIEFIIKSLLQKVRKINALRDNRPEGLIEFGMLVAQLTRMMITMKSENHLNNPCLVEELEDKLPVDLRVKWIEWIDQVTGRKRDVRHFSAWLQSQVDVARKLRRPQEFQVRDAKKTFDASNRQGKFPQRVHAAHGVHTTTGGKRSCYVCRNEGHFAGDCNELTSKNLQDRKKLVAQRRLCQACLVFGHKLADCRRKKKCTHEGCEEFQHQLLHQHETKAAVAEHAATETTNNVNGDFEGTLMGALPVILNGPGGQVQCLAFVDCGSSVTLMEDQLARDLGLVGEKQAFCMETMTSSRQFEDSRRVSCSIRGAWEKSKTFNLDGVRTLNQLNLSAMTQKSNELKERYPYLRGIPLPSFVNMQPRILIGSKHASLTAHRRIVESTSNAPIALQCSLGWVLGGQSEKNEANSIESCYHVCYQMSTEDSLHDLVKQNFTTEDFGVKIVQETRLSRENERALGVMRKTTTRLEGGRFQTGLLWKSDDIVLPESRRMALQRLQCQERRMDRDSVFAEGYITKIQEYEDKGFIRKLDPEEVLQDNPKTWYLPHFGVLNPNKPGKLRLVFDAAAKSHGVSLNSVLFQGPDLNNPLVSVLWRFRQYEFAYAGDIRDMFHRVFIQPDDRPSQRFLWRGTRRDIQPEEYEMMVMVFGATCSPCSAQYVKNLNADEHKSQFPEAAAAVKKSFYVDDFLHSSSKIEEATEMIKNVCEIQGNCGYEVVNWISNSMDVLKSIPDELRSKEMKNVSLESGDVPASRVLGLWWCPPEDIFTFKLTMHKVSLEVLTKARRPTKTEVLRTVMSVYDPLGFLGQLIVKAKILLQDVWRSGIGWDDTLTDTLSHRWNEWLEELYTITSVKVRRVYSLLIPNADEIQLHIFSDASEKAFAAVAFLRVEAGGFSEVSLVGSRTRVAPLKPLSIPRLELQGAVMATRFASAIKIALDITINRAVFWTDSMTVLHWIRSDSRSFKPFVAHRLGEMLETTEVEQWRHVPTLLNVADDATRDTVPCDLRPGSRWFNGPAFLYEAEDKWPAEKRIVPKLTDEELEIKTKVMVIMMKCHVPDVTRFSRFMRLVRCTAFVLRAKSRSFKGTGELTVEELRKAEMHLVKIAQQESFAEEITCLYGGKPIPKVSRLTCLEPFLDQEKVLRVQGRLKKGMLNMDATHPMILDNNHHFTKLLLQWEHEKWGHQGQRTVANEIRQRYWILGGMNAIKKAFHDCSMCKVKKFKPLEVRMADLPSYRLETKLKPFSNCGLDFFGPIIVKVGRKTDKRWGALFTCLSTRAVHLEVAYSLSTDSAIMAVNRMSSRRGRPQNIFSDNGTNFHGANNELKKALKAVDQTSLQQLLGATGVQWHFNPPAAPHMGGVWERLVGSVKKALEAILTDKHPNDETLQTVFCEAEMIVNSRPLTDVSVDPTDLESLTPNHFLLGWSGGSAGAEVVQPIWGQFDRHDLYLRRSWRVAQRLADEFWSRWTREYLPSLTRRSKWMKTREPVKIGDVVVLVEDNAPRNSWPKGVVTEAFPGKDGEVRVVEVKTASGKYRRPVVKLCKLDVLQSDEVPSSGGRMWDHKGQSVKEDRVEADRGSEDAE